jgi:L-fucose isomerase-like protein
MSTGKATDYPPLTTFRVFRDDGSSYVTSMAAGVTLEQSQDYFFGQKQWNWTETKCRTVVAVEEVPS